MKSPKEHGAKRGFSEHHFEAAEEVVDVQTQATDVSGGSSLSLRLCERSRFLQLPFWNGCEQEDACVPDLVLHSQADLMDAQQFCSAENRAAWSLCSRRGPSDGSIYVVEAWRRRVVVSSRLENQGENAYGASIHISTSPNLLFSSLIVKDQSDVQIECYNEEPPANQRLCNISSPFMKSLSQVSFRLEFEFNRSVLLDHIRIVMATTSEGEEGYPDDNVNNIFLPLRYQTDLLFTRDPNIHRFDISSSSSSWEPTAFNLTYDIQNLGLFSVHDLLFRADLWAVTVQQNQLVNITDFCIEQQTVGSRCTRPHPRTSSRVTAEDLSHLSQLNQSNSVSVAVQCRLELPGSTELRLVLKGELHLPTLHTVSFRSLQLLSAASIQLDAVSPLFLQENRPVRQIVLELRKQDDLSIPVWIILGSSLGGLLLLALLVLALWKLGFFNRRRRREEEEPVANGAAAEEL